MFSHCKSMLLHSAVPLVLLVMLCGPVQAAPSTDPELAMANSLFEQKKFAETVAELNSIIAKDPDKRAAVRLRANAYRDMKQWDAAIADYDKAIKLDPKEFGAYAGRGMAKHGAKNYAGAIEDFTMAVKLGPEKDKGSLLGRLGYAKYDNGDYRGALDTCSQSKQISTDTINTDCVGRSYLKLGQYDKAIKEFNSVVSMNDTLYLGYSDRAKAYLELANTDLANVEQSRKDIQKAISLKPDLWKLNDIKELLTKLPAYETRWKEEKAKREALLAKEREQEALKRPIIPTQRVYKIYKTILPSELVRSPNWAAMRQSDPTLAHLASSRWDTFSYPVVYQGRGSKMGASVNADQIRWSVPDEIVPGKPAQFKVEAPTGQTPFIAFINFRDYPLAVIRQFPKVDIKLSGPNIGSDEFNLLLPAITNHTAGDCQAGKAYPNRPIQLRNQERMQDVAHFGEGGGRYNNLVPKDLPMEEIPFTMASCNNGGLGGFTVSVYYDHSNLPLAEYYYQAVDDMKEDGIEFRTTPPGQKELRADGKDSVLLEARVKARPNDTSPTTEATADIVFSGVGEGADWIDKSKDEMRDGWKVIRIHASNPDSVRGPSRPPTTLTIRAETKDKDRLLASDYTLTIPDTPIIDAEPDIVEFVAKSGETASVKIQIENGGKDPWKFRSEYVQKDRPLAAAQFQPAEGKTVTLNLREAGLDPASGASNSETSVLRIIAEQQGRDPVERRVNIVATQEGLFTTTVGRDPEGDYYRVAADGSGKTTDVDFRVFLYDPATKKIVNSKEAVSNSIKIESIEPEESVAAQALKAGQMKQSFAGIRASNDPTGIYRFHLAKEIPGDGRIIRADFKATYTGRDEENFTAIFSLGLVTTSNGPGSADWQLELDRCQEVINKFVPVNYRAQMQAMLDKRKRTLGAEGLHLLREKIWQSAVDLTLGEGGQGYADEAAWADRITVTLEWADWAGNMAFGAVIGTWTGPYGATGSSILKASVISAINAYQDGRSPEDWLWDNFSTIPGIIEGKIIDVSTFEKMGMESKAKAWAIYVSYHFCKNLYNGATVIEALKNTSREVGSGLLSNWLNEQVQKSVAQAPASKTGKELSGTARPGESDAAGTIRKSMVARGGKLYADRDDVLAIMRDPSQVRALKDAPPEIRESFSNTRKAVYEQHDNEVVNYVKDHVSDMKNRMVKVMEFRTPGQDGSSINTDRDYRVCYYAGRDSGTGKEQWIEVDRRQWESYSYQAFARATGGPTDSPEAAQHWAEAHQQLATDKAHREASPDFMDQAKVWNPQSGKFENAQIVPNIVRVKAGQPGSRLKDPQALGHMYQMKVSDAKFKPEAFVQAQKAVKELDSIRKGYTEQKLNVGNLPPSVQNGMNAVIEVNKKLLADPNRRDPKAIADAEQTLRANGFQSLGDFMNKLGGQFEALKTVRN